MYMNQQNPGNPNNNSNGDGTNNRRPDNRRRPHNNQNRDNRPANPNAAQGQNPQGGSQGPRQPQAPSSNGGPQNRPQNTAQNANRSPGQNSNNNRRRNNNNRNRAGGQNRPQTNNQVSNTQQNGSTGLNHERVYEKYLNLLDLHLIARKKYHDLFYRAELSQKIKLEKNFYNTLYDIRDFESRMSADVKLLFEKRNNGYQLDRTYTSNHEMPIEGDVVPGNLPPAEPHYLQSQIQADYKEDNEESMGSIDDYLKYKNLA